MGILLGVRINGDHFQKIWLMQIGKDAVWYMKSRGKSGLNDLVPIQ